MTAESPAFNEGQLIYLREVFGVVLHPDITHIPEGRSGNCEVRYAVETNGKTGFIYEKLFRDGKEIASNHPDVLNRHSDFLSRAKGRVLLEGLGVGEMLFPLLENQLVTHVTVAEPDLHVAALLCRVIRSLPEPVFQKLTLWGKSVTDVLQQGEQFDCVQTVTQ